jgi:hypothetical protein
MLKWYHRMLLLSLPTSYNDLDTCGHSLHNRLYKKKGTINVCLCSSCLGSRGLRVIFDASHSFYPHS